MNTRTTQGIWEQLISKLQIPKGGIIIEFAPGFKSKIAQAFANIGFCGEYHLIEPNVKALDHTLAEYKRLLPSAKIIGHDKCISEINTTEKIPQEASALLANHALDDMVLSTKLTHEELEDFFSLNSGPDRVAQTKRLWAKISSENFASSIAGVVNTICTFVSRHKPKMTILSHYDGKTLVANNIDIANRAGAEVSKILRERLKHNNNQELSRIISMAKNNPRWVISTRK